MDELQDDLITEEGGGHARIPAGKRVGEDYLTHLTNETLPSTSLTGMFKDWFLDYASATVLDRAIPHLEDGLKPVQRRILHSMRQLEDGWYHKVANIIGHTMQYHPHGDGSIGNALVKLGQMELLVDPQGNWGNILTGDSAAAPRYIEARLTPFALDVVFNAKTTEWMKSYDGRNLEPVTLPVKFPLLLVQGALGIGVGLSSTVLPHNFNEVIDAAISYLRGEPFTLLPDLPTGAIINCSGYNDGKRGGRVRIRARIRKEDKRILIISEIPYGKGNNTREIIKSINTANEEGKIRVRKVEDNTAEHAEIIVHLAPDTSADRTIDALYKFTKCEISISPNACVIVDNEPRFMGVSDVLRHSVDRTRQLLQQELNIRLDELEAIWHFASLERLFIEQRLYLAIEECTTWEAVLSTIEQSLQPYVHLLRRSLTQEDIVKLTEIKIKRISRYDAQKADELLRTTEREMEEVQGHLARITEYTIAHFERLKKKYGANVKRRSEIADFEDIEATRVVAATRKLYVDRADGFFGTDLKGGEYVCDCSDIDDVLLILRSGRYMITPVQEKRFYDRDIIHIGVYNRNDTRTIYNIIYWDSQSGYSFAKRCSITSLIRDRDYNLTQGHPGSRILYLGVNPNGEAETVRLHIESPLTPRQKPYVFDYDFADLCIRGRDARGNIVTKASVASAKLKERGESTLGGIKVWLDRDILRLNYEGRGELLGEFSGSDRVLALYGNGRYQTLPYDPSTRFEENPVWIGKFDTTQPFSIAFFDGDQGYFYLKRCTFEDSETLRSFIGENPTSRFVAASASAHPILEVHFKGKQANRPMEAINAPDFIAVKSYKARGKRISTYEVGHLAFQDPPLDAHPGDAPSEHQPIGDGGIEQ